MIPRRLVPTVAVVAIVAAACSSSSSDERTIPEPPSAITIASGTGNVSVSVGNETGTTILAEIDASGEAPVWTANLEGSVLVIDDGCGDRTDCTVDFVIETEAGADLTIQSDGGGITVVDMNSTVTISGTASNVLLNGITGPIAVDLVSGDLLGARLITTDATFRTGDGDLDVTLTQAFSSLELVSGSGNVTAQVPGGGYDIDASTGDGDVDLKVEDVDGATSSILMRTESGDVTVYRR